MKETAKEWLLLGVGVLIISVAIFGTMYTAVIDKGDAMNTTVTNTNLP